MNKSKEIIDTLIKKGFETYYVGGCVRDHILGKKAKDIDIVTKAKPEEICDIFKLKKAGVGKSFKVCIVNGYDVATFRKDTYFGESDKNVKIEYADTLEEDLERRDLTINSLAMDTSGKIIDLFDGRKHIESRTIDLIGDADKRIWEDPCRIVRAVRFRTRLKGTFTDKTFKALNGNRLVLKVAPERVRDELMLSMKEDNPSEFFTTLNEINILEMLFVEIYNLLGIDGGIHHTEDVFTHSMMVGDSMSKKNPLLRLTGYIHDVGKAETVFKDDKGNNRFFGHDEADTVKKFLNRYKFSKSDTRYVKGLTNLHMRVYINQPYSNKSLRKLLRDLEVLKINVNDWYKLKIADIKGNGIYPNVTYSQMKEFLGRIKTVHKDSSEGFTPKMLNINGDDIMTILNIPQGDKVGKILKHLYEIVLDDPTKNQKPILELMAKSAKTLL